MQQVPKFDNLILDLQSEKGVLWITFNRPKVSEKKKKQIFIYINNMFIYISVSLYTNHILLLYIKEI